MTDDLHPRISRTAYLLGYAGLLPQVAAVALVGWGFGDRKAHAIAVGFGLSVACFYAAVILSFLGGMWWGFAMMRSAGRGGLAALAVLPSLVGFALLCLGSVGLPLSWVLVALGVAIVLTLPVDRHLTATGEAPQGWMHLRAPLSLGLGGLTILAGVLAA